MSYFFAGHSPIKIYYMLQFNRISSCQITSCTWLVLPPLCCLHPCLPAGFSDVVRVWLMILTSAGALVQDILKLFGQMAPGFAKGGAVVPHQEDDDGQGHLVRWGLAWLGSLLAWLAGKYGFNWKIMINDG